MRIQFLAIVGLRSVREVLNSLPPGGSTLACGFVFILFCFVFFSTGRIPVTWEFYDLFQERRDKSDIPAFFLKCLQLKIFNLPRYYIWG